MAHELSWKKREAEKRQLAQTRGLQWTLSSLQTDFKDPLSFSCHCTSKQLNDIRRQIGVFLLSLPDNSRAINGYNSLQNVSLTFNHLDLHQSLKQEFDKLEKIGIEEFNLNWIVNALILSSWDQYQAHYRETKDYFPIDDLDSVSLTLQVVLKLLKNNFSFVILLSRLPDPLLESLVNEVSKLLEHMSWDLFEDGIIKMAAILAFKAEKLIFKDFFISDEFYRYVSSYTSKNQTNPSEIIYISENLMEISPKDAKKIDCLKKSIGRNYGLQSDQSGPKTIINGVNLDNLNLNNEQVRGLDQKIDLNQTDFFWSFWSIKARQTESMMSNWLQLMSLECLKSNTSMWMKLVPELVDFPGFSSMESQEYVCTILKAYFSLLGTLEHTKEVLTPGVAAELLNIGFNLFSNFSCANLKNSIILHLYDTNGFITNVIKQNMNMQLFLENNSPTRILNMFTMDDESENSVNSDFLLKLLDAMIYIPEMVLEEIVNRILMQGGASEGSVEGLVKLIGSQSCFGQISNQEAEAIPLLSIICRRHLLRLLQLDNSSVSPSIFEKREETFSVQRNRLILFLRGLWNTNEPHVHPNNEFGYLDVPRMIMNDIKHILNAVKTNNKSKELKEKNNKTNQSFLVVKCFLELVQHMIQSRAHARVCRYKNDELKRLMKEVIEWICRLDSFAMERREFVGAQLLGLTTTILNDIDHERHQWILNEDEMDGIRRASSWVTGIKLFALKINEKSDFFLPATLRELSNSRKDALSILGNHNAMIDLVWACTTHCAKFFIEKIQKEKVSKYLSSLLLASSFVVFVIPKQSLNIFFEDFLKNILDTEAEIDLLDDFRDFYTFETKVHYRACTFLLQVLLLPITPQTIPLIDAMYPNGLFATSEHQLWNYFLDFLISKLNQNLERTKKSELLNLLENIVTASFVIGKLVYGLSKRMDECVELEILRAPKILLLECIHNINTHYLQMSEADEVVLVHMASQDAFSTEWKVLKALKQLVGDWKITKQFIAETQFIASGLDQIGEFLDPIHTKIYPNGEDDAL